MQKFMLLVVLFAGLVGCRDGRQKAPAPSPVVIELTDDESFARGYKAGQAYMELFKEENAKKERLQVIVDADAKMVVSFNQGHRLDGAKSEPFKTGWNKAIKEAYPSTRRR